MEALPSAHVFFKKFVFTLGLTQKLLRMDIVQPCMQTRPVPADKQSASTVQRAAQFIPLLSPTHSALSGHELEVPAAKHKEAFASHSFALPAA